MTLKQLVSTIRNYLEIESSRSETQALELTNDIFYNELIQLITNNSLNAAELNDENTKPFKDFLERRWNVIRGTDVEYHSKPNYLLNKICILMAKQINSELQNSLLFPTVQRAENVSGTNFNESSINKFIISDDGLDFIDVSESLDMAKEDGVLKNTTLIPKIPKEDKDEEELKEDKSDIPDRVKISNLAAAAGNLKPLTDSEKERLLKNKTAKQYYNAILESQKLKTSGRSIGSALYILKERLYLGSIGVEGEETEASKSATMAIYDFNQYIDTESKNGTLSIAEKNDLFSRTAPGLKSFGEIWEYNIGEKDVWESKEKLEKHQQGLEQSTITCMGLVSGNIESILKIIKISIILFQ